MPTLPIWLQIILEIIVGACLGTIAGLIAGAGYVFWETHPYDKAIGSQDVQAMARGFSVIALIIIGGGLGLVIGAVTALVLHVRKARKRAATLIIDL